MAFQLPKIDFSDAKTRVIIIFSGFVAFILVIYLTVHLLSAKTTTTGSSHVANAPGNLQSVPGGQLTPEYYRALVQANKQAAKQAQMSGGSAVPTLLNEPGAQPSFEQPTTTSCTVVCPNSDNVNVEDDINDLVKAGKLSADDGKKLADLAKQNVAVSEYSAQLDNLVKTGKLTPEQARKLLDDYKKQHENKLIQESGKTMDALIKSGQLPLDVANQLLDLQKSKASPAEYAAKLNELVREGKISPDTAGQLLAQYTQQHATEAAKEARGELAEMAATGQIKPEVAKELQEYQDRHVSQKEYEEELQHLVKQGKLTPEQAERLLTQYKQLIPPDVAAHLAELQQHNVSVPEYQAELQRLVAAGKITPEQAQDLLEQYRQVKSPTAKGDAMDDIVKQAEKANESSVREMAESGRISPETAQKLLDLQQSKVPVEEYKRQLDDLVRQGKLDPADAQKLLISYMQQRGAGVQDLLDSGKITPQTAQKLLALQQANVPIEEYRRQLDQLVREGKISSSDAQRLLNNYAQLQGAKEQANGVQALVAAGKITPETAQKLTALQQANAPVEEYKRQLDELVREGKISPADAQKLLVSYMQQKGGGVQDLLREGKISSQTAEKLMELQRANVPVEEYKRQLDELVRTGKISSADAQKLLSNYQQMRGAGVQDLLAAGKISPETAQQLTALQQANVPVSEYKQRLDELVREGKISSEDAQKLLNNYTQMQGGGAGVKELLSAGRLPPEVEQKILDMQHANVPVEEYKRHLDALVKEGKITPADEQRLMGDYQKLHAVREEAERLNSMRAKNAPVEEYANELKRAVTAGVLTPEQAARLLDEYKASKTHTNIIPLAAVPAGVKGGEALTALQKRVQAATPAATPAPGPTINKEQFSAAAARAKAQSDQEQQQRIQALMNGMSQQAGQLISSWQPPTMAGQVGSSESATETSKTTKKATGASASGATADSGASASSAPIIKAGTIIYAILDTAINSDFPDSPVLATIVAGKYRGAKLLGKVGVTQGQDRVTLSFKLMDMEDWPSGKTINAFAIDPDTARTALASRVNYHYFQRYGALFASSFLTGYANAISNSGATTSAGIFGTTTTHPALSPSSKIMTGLGQVGTTLGTSVQSYTSTPPTVKIDPGTSLGILFMADVSG